MEVLILAAIVLAIVVFVLKAQKRTFQEAEVWPFYARKPLTNPEQVLYFRLVQALPDHIILSQVQLSRILGVKKGHNFQAWQNRINRMSADFVVCNKDSSIVAVIELDDATHNHAKRQQADAKKDKALNAAEIRIVRWQAKAIPDEEAIRTALLTVQNSVIDSAIANVI